MAKAHSRTKGKDKTSQGKSETVKTIGGFRILHVGNHVCYMRKHDGEDDRTVFLVNVPTDTTERHIRALLGSAGAIESVQLWKGKQVEREEEHDDAPAIIPLPVIDPRHPFEYLPTATGAHITFLDESSLERALNLSHIKSWPDPFEAIADAKKRLATETDPKSKRKHSHKTAEEALAGANTTASPPNGLEYLLERYRRQRPALDAVRAHADSVIANFEWRRLHPKQDTKGIQAASIGPNGELLDEDGFVIVQRTGKYGRAGDTQGGSVRIGKRAGPSNEDDTGESATKKKRLELDDFYRFQRREAKRQELASLRARFQKDQEKVQKLKEGRRFKPF